MDASSAQISFGAPRQPRPPAFTVQETPQTMVCRIEIWLSFSFKFKPCLQNLKSRRQIANDIPGY